MPPKGRARRYGRRSNLAINHAKWLAKQPLGYKESDSKRRSLQRSQDIQAIKIPKREIKLTVTNQNVVHGYGVLAAEFIPQGTLIRKFTGRIYPSEAAALQDRICTRSTGTIIFKTSKAGGRWIVPDRSCKEAKYLNTSSNQDEINVWSYESTAEDVWFYSAKDIEEGEELLLEYNIARK